MVRRVERVSVCARELVEEKLSERNKAEIVVDQEVTHLKRRRRSMLDLPSP